MEILRKIFLSVISILIVAVAGLGIGSGADPEVFDSLSPIKSPGMATTSAVGALPGLLSVGAKWPEWATQRDKENLRRSVRAMNTGDSKKFVSTLMVLQGELEERNHEALELKRVMIGELAGVVLATTLIPLVFAIFFTFAILLFSAILSRTWINPIDWAERGGRLIFGVAGVWLFRLFLGIILLAIMTFAGLWMRPYQGLLFGYTELLAWLNLFLLAMWLMVIMGLGSQPRPEKKICPRCNGAGKIMVVRGRDGPVITKREEGQRKDFVS
ncbi:hypothetical protein MNBD_NITROSPINAE02-981 [hydrothermal vent metagenome]|uniref:Uncharacterized protein n=1 Tax=hydrothermal vent metagenome TaxID=652676 RepID=A0A3B1C6T9_9ZZZZ